MISDLIAIINLIAEHAEDTSVLSALFKYDGARVEGDDSIEVIKIPVKGKSSTWFYHIKDFEDYIFVPFPVIPSVYVDFGTMEGSSNANAKYFRYVSTPLSTVMSGGGANNVEVDFMVFGYRPKDILDYTKGKTIR